VRSKGDTDDRSKPQQKSVLFDHLVGAGKERRWYGKAKRPGCREVELETGRLLHRQPAIRASLA